MAHTADPRGCDVLIVGAGPAGLSAACTAGEAGARVIVVDAGPSAGGQYWRNADANKRLQHHRGAFDKLQRRMDRADVHLATSHSATRVARDGSGFVLRCAIGPEPRAANALTTLRGQRLIIATGAYDRQMPLPGWELPGVLAAGGVQAMLKAHAVAAGARVVVAGSGPFLLSVADALLSSGVKVPAVVEANDPITYTRHPGALAGTPTKVAEAARYAAKLALSRTPYRRRHAVVAALGDDELAAVRIARLDRAGLPISETTRTIHCDALAIGWGFTPQLELALQLGAETCIGGDGSLIVRVDGEQRTSVQGAWAAGEVTGIGGAELARIEGEIAGRSATATSIPVRLSARGAALRRFAAAMHAVHWMPAFLLTQLPDDTLVCRCEEVTAAEVRAAVCQSGATDARTAKLLARPGMGWCQGRVCGYATAAYTARLRGREVSETDLRAFTERPFAVPLPLHLLARRESESP